MRTATETPTRPRVATVIMGVRSFTMPESNTSAQSAPRSSSRIHRSADADPISSSPSTQKRTFTGSSPARASSHPTWRSGRKLPLSSAAPRA